MLKTMNTKKHILSLLDTRAHNIVLGDREARMSATVQQFIGRGLYTIEEAAFYARVPIQTMGRWLFGNKKWERVFRPEIVSHEKHVSFVDLVQSLAIRAIRIQHKVPLQKIRQAMAVAEKDWKVKHPFARAHTTFLFGDELVICPGIDANGDDIYIEASGNHRRGRLLNRVVELYLKDLTFDPSGLATLYRPYIWNSVPIVMNPQRYFGEPLTPSGHTAETLWEASQIEGGLAPAAKAYGVTVEEVEAACRFYDHLLDRKAA